MAKSEARAAIVAPRARNNDGDAARAPGDAGTAVKAQLRRQGDNLWMNFSFATPTPAAVFRHADTLWLVFDSAAPIDLTELNGNSGGMIRSAALTTLQGGQAVAIRLSRPRLSAVAAEGTAWSIVVGDAMMDPGTPFVVARDTSGKRPTATIAFEKPGRLHRLHDADSGATLLVVTALAPARGLVKNQNFVEFRALASTHGVVLQPLADDIDVALLDDKVVISRPMGLALSSAVGTTSGGQSQRAAMFDSQSWGFDRQAPFAERQGQLMTIAAMATEGARAEARLDLARFYLARDMYAEAKGVLDVAVRDQRPSTENANSLVLRAISKLMMGRAQEALKDLSDTAIGNQHNAQLWRAMAFAQTGQWPQASERFRDVESMIGSLPIELQRAALIEATRAAIETRDFGGAVGVLQELETVGTTQANEPVLALMTGRIAEGLGRKQDALAAYRSAAESADRPSAARGRLLATTLLFQLGDMKRADVITALERLTAIWRGDDTEVEALQVLARLYTEDSRYRDAFQVVRTALAAHPNSELIYLLNRKPDRALAALRSTRVPDASTDLRMRRLLIEARALSDTGRHDLALDIIANIESREAVRLRSDISWTAGRWRDSGEQMELLYGERWRDFRPLDDVERADIMRAGIGYALAQDTISLARLREKYAAKMADSPDGRAFETVTTNLGASSAEFKDIARVVAAVDTLEGFLRVMRASHPETAFGEPEATARPGSGGSFPVLTVPAKADPAPTGSLRALPRLAPGRAR
ncbi:MAG: hypothetical protein HY056_04680 [Proteobacteria bacterium]|nr:hypothetical protein [Pseudomonadota bacterium]